MIEIIIATIIAVFAGFVIIRSLKSSSKGKCSSGCSSCKAEKSCSGKSNITIK